jgi:ubiquinone/menaquinone biosynthesis C-methylase UbiE
MSSQMTSPDLNDLLQPDASLRQVRSGIRSTLPMDVEGAPYDTRAAAYDRIVGSELNNRLMWGTSTTSYRAFADRALADGGGVLLDAGAGSAVFTAEAYVHAARPVILVDRSLGMLDAARDRIATKAGGTVPNHVTLLQADVTALPLRPNAIKTVLSMGMLHLFEDPVGYVEELLPLLTSDGTLFATSLVAERTIGGQYLRLLHRAGEVAPPRTYEALQRSLTAELNGTVKMEREGSMAFLAVQAS